MNVGSVTSALPPVTTGGVESGRGASPAGDGVPFSNLMTQFLQEVDQQQQTVRLGVNDLIAGKTENIHELAIHVAQADIAFRMVMEVRDKLITAYQELMRMQV